MRESGALLTAVCGEFRNSRNSPKTETPARCGRSWYDLVDSYSVLLDRQSCRTSSPAGVGADDAGTDSEAVCLSRNAGRIRDSRDTGARGTPVTVQADVLRTSITEIAGCRELLCRSDARG